MCLSVEISVCQSLCWHHNSRMKKDCIVKFGKTFKDQNQISGQSSKYVKNPLYWLVELSASYKTKTTTLNSWLQTYMKFRQNLCKNWRLLRMCVCVCLKAWVTGCVLWKYYAMLCFAVSLHNNASPRTANHQTDPGWRLWLFFLPLRVLLYLSFEPSTIKVAFWNDYVVVEWP